MAGLAFLFYHFNIFTFGIYLIPFLASLLLFGWTLGIFTTGIILRFGSSAQVLAFGFILLIQPFSAVFYPVSILPGALQYLAYLLPSTYVFEGMRAAVSTGTVPWNLLLISLGINVLYMILVSWYFARMFARVKRRGLLHKLEQ
jgi:ABC-2 type transport system permease protein